MSLDRLAIILVLNLFWKPLSELDRSQGTRDPRIQERAARYTQVVCRDASAYHQLSNVTHKLNLSVILLREV